MLLYLPIHDKFVIHDLSMSILKLLFKIVRTQEWYLIKVDVFQFFCVTVYINRLYIKIKLTCHYLHKFRFNREILIIKVFIVFHVLLVIHRSDRPWQLKISGEMKFSFVHANNQKYGVYTTNCKCFPSY